MTTIEELNYKSAVYGCQYPKLLMRAAAELTALQKEVALIRPQLRTHIELLQTLLEQFDARADGAPDATALDIFCNEMIGLYNGVLLKETQTLVQERDSLRKQNAELKDALARSDFLAKERLEQWNNYAESYVASEAACHENIKKIAELQKENKSLTCGVVGLQELHNEDMQELRKQNAALLDALTESAKQNAAFQSACLEPVYSPREFGTPGKLICIRCRLCGSECQNHDEMKHDAGCVLYKSIATQPEKTDG